MTLPTPTEMFKRWGVALDFAKLHHGDQKRRYTGEPYWHHLLRVARWVSMTTGATSEMIEAALLHDVLEDTKVTEPELRVAFGDVVTGYVAWLTDLPLSYGNREVRKIETITRLHTAPNEVKTIKLADILDNGMELKLHDPSYAERLFLPEKTALLPALKGGDSRLYKKVAAMLVLMA